MLFTGAGGSGKKIKKTSACERSRREEAESYDQDIHEAEAAELEQENRDCLTNLASMMDLSPTDYHSMRDYISYDPPRTSKRH